MLKTIIIGSTLLLGSLLYTWQPASAITADEALRLIGVLGRYADDINRTFGPNYRNPNHPPTQPAPSSDSNPVPDDSEIPIDELLQQ
jgi:hypothetical protein